MYLNVIKTNCYDTLRSPWQNSMIGHIQMNFRIWIII